MATAAETAALGAKTDTGGMLSGAVSLANLFLPQTTTTGGTSTTGGTTTDNRNQTTTNSGGTTTVTQQAIVSPEAVQATINSILSGTAGLAAVSSGQKGAGMYNSSTNQLLTNDLLARASAEAARLSTANTTTTVAPQTSSTTQAGGGTTTTGNTTTAGTQTTAARVSPSMAGALGAGLTGWGMVPQSIKDTIKSSIGIGAKDAAASAASNIAKNSNDPAGFAALESAASNGGASTGTAGIEGLGVQNVAGASFGTDTSSGISLAGDSSAVNDVAGFTGMESAASDTGGYDTTNMADSGEGFNGFSDATGAIGDALAGLGSSLGGIASGVGDTVASASDSIGSWLDDTFQFADGGIVNASAANKLRGPKAKPMAKSKPGYADGGAVQSTSNTMLAGIDHSNLGPQSDSERATVYSLMGSLPGLLSALIGRDQKKTSVDSNDNDGDEAGGPSDNDGDEDDKGVKKYADGGPVLSTVSDLKGSGYIANTGLRNTGALQVNSQTSDSNLASILGRLQSISTPAKNPIVTGNTGSAGVGASIGTGANSSAPLDQLMDMSTGGDAVASPSNNGLDAPSSVGGISAAIGVNSTAVSAAMSAVASAAGITAPGMIGLANSQTNSQASNGFVSSLAGIVSGIASANPVVAFAVQQAVAALLAQNSKPPPPPPPSTPTPATPGIGTNTGDNGGDADDGSGVTASVSVGESTPADGDAGVTGGNAPGVSGTTTSDGPTGIGGSGIGSADGSSDGSASSSSSDGVGTSSGVDGGSGDGGVGWAEGGSISGPGTGVSDSIDAKLSDGEYVIPADVVEALGVGHFDKLLAQYHTPAAKQRSQSARK